MNESMSGIEIPTEEINKPNELLVTGVVGEETIVTSTLSANYSREVVSKTGETYKVSGSEEMSTPGVVYRREIALVPMSTAGEITIIGLPESIQSTDQLRAGVKEIATQVANVGIEKTIQFWQDITDLYTQEIWAEALQKVEHPLHKLAKALELKKQLPAPTPKEIG
jgi:hypothetical protein